MAQDTFADLFADLALTEHPGSNDQVQEVKPPVLEKQFFQPSNEIADPTAELSYQEKLKQFENELQKLRVKYAPFLENHVPEPPLERRRLSLTEFQFRYQTEADYEFTNVLNGLGEWEQVTIPDYRGPAGEDGKWTGYYRTEFKFEKTPGKRVYLVFKGVDYAADVYVNNKCVGRHEGFFAPFEFDVTELIQEHNVLVVEVKNDYPTLGVQENQRLDGDKIYAATGPGWDDPESGWHHCPPGAGIYNQVYLEERADLFVHDVFVRPDIDRHSIEVWVDLSSSSDQVVEDFKFELSVWARNYDGGQLLTEKIDVPYTGPGLNYYRYRLSFPDYRLWEPDQPWLYTARVKVAKDGELLDSFDRNFGMRKFHQDEEAEPKGTLYLNNRPIILRGANEMGHLQQCVMRGDFEQLIDDILIAKLANMNYYRITQRPVQEEIYDYLDMLGMMHQCDLPLFGTLRRNQFYEAIKQVGEMERLIRSHPSSIMVTFINEPVAIRKHPDPKHKYNRRYREKAHRHLFRQELEYFFAAARKAIALENPDRVVKNVEGDYDPPTLEGMPDFHCYCMWYTNHGVPLGKLHMGYLPAVKQGWKVTCGEYGTEGLDNYPVMEKYYPREWLPEDEHEPWQPNRIVRAQTYSMHGDWYPEQSSIRDWIAASQEHQALATKLMTDAFRRRSDLLVGTAVHLLIDAWPSGWMKALVDVDRVPKPAYFAYQESLVPVRVNLRSDRWKVYCGDQADLDVWLLNDTAEDLRDCKVIVTVRDDQRIYQSFDKTITGKAVSPTYTGTVRLKVPQVADRSLLYLDAALYSSTGEKINQERLTLEVFQKHALPKKMKTVYLGAAAADLVSRLELSAAEFKNDLQADVIIAAAEEIEEHRAELIKQVEKGAHLLVIRGAQPLAFKFGENCFTAKSMNPVYFAAVNRESELMQQFKPDDFAYFYSALHEQLDFTADCYLLGSDLEPLVYTYQKVNEPGGKPKRIIAGTTKYGSGRVTVCGLPLAGKIGFNPTLDRFMQALVQF